MLFGFFRRRQKMVIIIMAVLMVSFLIGFQGFQADLEVGQVVTQPDGTHAGRGNEHALLAQLVRGPRLAIGRELRS